MKVMLIGSVLFGSLSLMAAEEADYKHCAGTLKALSGETNEFAEMNSQGEFKINRNASSMKVEGNKIIYSSFEQDKKTQKLKSDAKKDDQTQTINQETFEVEYENILEGKPIGKVKKISYNIKNVKDLDSKKPGAVDIAFDFKNGHCIPVVKKIDYTAGLSGALKVFAKGAFKMSSYHNGERDIYKCKELQDYIPEVDFVKSCMNSLEKLDKLKRLEQFVNNVEGKNEDMSSKKIAKSLNKAFEIIGKAQTAINNCAFSGYMDVLSDDEFWKKVEAKNDNKESEGKSLSK